jgi:hypothetical protein
VALRSPGAGDPHDRGVAETVVRQDDLATPKAVVSRYSGGPAP